jgi:hypothetical protein
MKDRRWEVAYLIGKKSLDLTRLFTFTLVLIPIL